MRCWLRPRKLAVTCRNPSLSSRDVMGGTSISYLTKRLRDLGRHDLLAGVETGRISTYAAAEAAGLVTRRPIKGGGSSNQTKRRRFQLGAVLRSSSTTEEAAVRRFSAEVLALFAALESVAPHNRANQTFKDAEHELARQLDLVSEWWTRNSVLDRSSGPHHPPQYVAHQDWHRCRAVRDELLAAIESRTGPIAIRRKARDAPIER
jgi:hypothetical protein